MPKRTLVDRVMAADDLAAEVQADAEKLRHQSAQRRLQAKYRMALQEKDRAVLQAELLADLQQERERLKFERLAARKPSKSTAMLVLSDWHVEERVDPSTINGINEFNPTIASARIRRVFSKALELLDAFYSFTKTRELVVALLGDMITGYIHEELVQNNYMSPTEATLFAQDHIVAGLDQLLKESRSKSILVPCCHGNHGRTTPKRLVSVGHKNSYEWAMYHTLAKAYRNTPRVAFKIEDGIHNWVDLHGNSLRLHHGDNIKYQGGSGGPSVPALRAIKDWNTARVATCDVFGHLHQRIDHGSFLLNGSLIGFNAYGLSIKAQYERPQQEFMVWGEAGKLMSVPIFC